MARSPGWPAARATPSVALLLAMAGCATVPLPSRDGPYCEGHGLRIDAGFERGGMAGCRVESAERVVVELRGETRPINDSAWYAFRVRAQSARELSLELRLDDGEFRYRPETSRDGRQWASLPADRLAIAGDKRSASLRVVADRTPLFVAAQPLQSGAQALAALRPVLRDAGFTEREIGRSHDDRPLVAFESRPAGARGSLVLIARQHPPETTGATAFDAFVRRLATAPEAAVLRRELAVLVLPLLNPDGLARGHWRGNATGADLNRDWATRAEPETAAAAAAIEAMAARHPLLAVLDFHSTRRDVLYAPPTGAARENFGDDYVAALLQRLGSAAPPVERGHRAGRGTAKAWTLDTFGAVGLTYEVGDETAPSAAARQAELAADVLAGVARNRLAATVKPPTAAAFRFTAWPGPPVPVWYHRPAATLRNAPVVFVMHGVQRDADRYLAEWIGLAETFGFVVVVPEFPNKDFPGADAYNLGGTLDDAGRPRPREQWAYSVLEGIFDDVRRRESLDATGYRLYGHSAGAQFVHRFVLFDAGPRLERAVSANAGWYTLPETGVEWPYGLAGSVDGGASLAQALRRPMTVLVGEADNDPDHPSLRRSPEALRQGAHRLARGLNFYARAQAAAQERGIALAWSCATAPGLGHDNGRAAGFAISLLLGESPAAGANCTALPAH